MNIDELDRYLRALLSIEAFDDLDASQNGLQVSCSKKPIRKIAFAVDACLENFHKAKQQHADMLFVHHGLFWNKSLLLTGSHYKRLAYLIQNDMALYAVHLPLDADPVYGNNAGIARNLSLCEIEPFGIYHGVPIGVKGRLVAPNSANNTTDENGCRLDEVLTRLFKRGEEARIVLPFGPEKIQTVGIISGAASGDLPQAISAGLDCFITGEVKHEAYHQALENKITVIAGGHYQTETFGVQNVMEKLAADTHIETIFLDTPTGL